MSNVEHGHVAPSAELAEAYIALGADRARVQHLLDAIHHQSRLARTSQRGATRRSELVATPPQEAVAISRADDVRRHYIVERYDLVFDYTAAGAISAVRSQAYIRAVRPGVHYYYTGVNADASSRAGRVRVSPISGGTLEYVDESPAGANDIYFRLDRPLDPSDEHPHLVDYVVETGDDDLADPQIMYNTRDGIREHSVEVRFHAPALPVTIWSFGAPDSYTADRPQPGATFAPDSTGTYHHKFDRIVPGWCYGLTWVWPANLRRPNSEVMPSD